MLLKSLRTVLITIILTQAFCFAQKREVGVYYADWGSPYRHYSVKDIQISGSASKINVLFFAFCIPKPDSNGTVVPTLLNPYEDYVRPYTEDISVDGKADDSTQPLRGQFNQLKKLKAMHPGLKIVLSIGGWGGSGYFSDAALTDISRQIFVDKCINEFIFGNLPVDSTAGGLRSASGVFDGFDIDWEFPLKGGAEGTHYNENDKENYTKLLALFRRRLNSVNPDLILTAAVPADKPNVNNFDIKSAAKYLNWFNLMTYDFHGSWDNAAAHHTNLLSSPHDTTAGGAKYSLDKSVKYFIDSLGVSPQMIMPGVAFYGKYWIVKDSVNGGLYQPANDSSGMFSGGFGNYSNLITLPSKGYEYYWDSLAMAPWLYDPGQKIFWTFDDAKSVSLKAHYVEAYDLRGLMCWEISGDDSIGTLVNTMYSGNMPLSRVKEPANGDLHNIKITFPEDGAEIAAGSNLIINTSGRNTDGATVKVEFFVDGKSIGYDSEPPFDWVWFNTKEGEHKIRAVAFDGEGNESESEAVYVIVGGKK